VVKISINENLLDRILSNQKILLFPKSSTGSNHIFLAFDAVLNNIIYEFYEEAIILHSY